MKCRVIYKPDGTISVIHPASKARMAGEKEEDFLERVFTRAMDLGGFRGFDFDDIDRAELPGRSERDKWRGGKGQGVRVDHTVTTPAEKRRDDEALLDAELVKADPDLTELIRIRIRLERGVY